MFCKPTCPAAYCSMWAVCHLPATGSMRNVARIQHSASASALLQFSLVEGVEPAHSQHDGGTPRQTRHSASTIPPCTKRSVGCRTAANEEWCLS
eukprot:1037857-Prymnesium_polylepis.2